jgi:hypothetical protein
MLTKTLSRYCAHGEENKKNAEQGSLHNLRLVPSIEIVTNFRIRFSNIENSLLKKKIIPQL